MRAVVVEWVACFVSFCYTGAGSLGGVRFSRERGRAEVILFLSERKFIYFLFYIFFLFFK